MEILWMKKRCPLTYPDLNGDSYANMRVGKPGMGWGDDAGPNVGADQWEYPYLHNLFEAAREQFGF